MMELAPLPGHHASDFLAARLVYKVLGYLEAKRLSGAGKRGRPRR